MDHNMAKIEKKLNTIGYIPFLSILSGGFRIVLGNVQQFLGNIGFLYRGGDYLMSKDPKDRDLAAENHWYRVHGGSNTARGVVELVPIIGNLTTLFYDKVLSIRLNYTYEKLPEGVSPIMDDSRAVAENR